MCAEQSQGAPALRYLSWGSSSDVPRAEIIYVDPGLVLLPPEDHKSSSCLHCPLSFQ